MRGADVGNPILINLAALCIILATAYGGFKEVVLSLQAQQVEQQRKIDSAGTIIDDVLGIER